MILFEYFLMHSGLVLITNENEFELILNSEGDLVEILEKLDGYQECKTKREIEEEGKALRIRWYNSSKEWTMWCISYSPS